MNETQGYRKLYNFTARLVHCSKYQCEYGNSTLYKMFLYFSPKSAQFFYTEYIHTQNVVLFSLLFFLFFLPFLPYLHVKHQITLNWAKSMPLIDLYWIMSFGQFGLQTIAFSLFLQSLRTCEQNTHQCLSSIHQKMHWNIKKNVLQWKKCLRLKFLNQKKKLKKNEMIIWIHHKFFCTTDRAVVWRATDRLELNSRLICVAGSGPWRMRTNTDKFVFLYQNVPKKEHKLNSMLTGKSTHTREWICEMVWRMMEKTYGLRHFFLFYLQSSFRRLIVTVSCIRNQCWVGDPDK